MTSPMPDTQAHRFAAALILPDEPARTLKALAKTYDLPPWEPAIPLHITLTPPFTTHIPAEELRERWQAVAAGRTPFRVTLNGFGRFDNEESVFFVRVADNAELTHLADDTFSAVTDLGIRRSHPFTPHVTLAALASRITVDEYVARTAPKAPHLPFTCDRFAMLCLDESAHRWNVIHEFIFAP